MVMCFGYILCGLIIHISKLSCELWMGRIFLVQTYMVIVERRGNRYYAYRKDRKGSVAKGTAGSFEEFKANELDHTVMFDRTAYRQLPPDPQLINKFPHGYSDSNYIVAVTIGGRDSNGRKTEYTGYSQPFKRREAYDEAKEEAEQVGRKNMIESAGITPGKVIKVNVNRYTPLLEA